MRATRAIIHLDHLRDNIALVREKTGTRICMPVKADAYGHGYLAIAKTALDAGVEYLATATVREGEELREGGITAPILLFSIPLPTEIDSLIAAGLEPLAGDGEYIDALESRAAGAGKKIPLHLKIDTGMGRIGCRPEDASRLAFRIAESKSLTLAGTATHLAVSDSTKTEDIAYTKKQLEIFRSAIESIRAMGINPGIIHAANTGAVTFHNDGWFDMVRPGILLYGYAPEGPDGNPAMAVKPLMELASCLSYIKAVKKGDSVSYGRAWTAGEDTLIGTIPLGYADGLPRLLSNNWQIHIMKEKSGETEAEGRPLAGTICMDECMVDLGKDSTARRWDTVTIFGGAAPHAGVMASRLGTIPYEITCQINKRVPRVYING
ncbi:MAG: alanine racemase [Spirochaetaceae bacterium]|jgi:alanine racemase|nr:alanine racemase [Spirochaetaceae bacterium]